MSNRPFDRVEELRLAIAEMKHAGEGYLAYLRERVEPAASLSAIASRLEFNERRAREPEGAVVYRATEVGEPPPQRPAPQIPQPRQQTSPRPQQQPRYTPPQTASTAPVPITPPTPRAERPRVSNRVATPRDTAFSRSEQETSRSRARVPLVRRVWRWLQRLLHL